MRKKTAATILGILVLLIAASILYMILDIHPAEKTVDRFLGSLLNNSGSSFQEYLPDYLKDHPFISLIQQNKLIKGYTIDDHEKLQDNIVQVKASFTTPDGIIAASFEVKKEQEKWELFTLPTVTKHVAAIPLSRQPFNPRLTEYQMDVMGTPFTCTRPAGAPLLEIGKPVSLTLLGDTILETSLLRPITLTRVLSLSSTMIEDPYYGNLDLGSGFGVYKQTGEELTYMGSMALPIGILDVKLYRTDDQLGRVAIYNDQILSKEKIRVALNSTGFNGLTHNEISITCSENFWAKTLVKPALHYDFIRGDKITFKPSPEGILLFCNDVRLAVSPQRWYIGTDEGVPLNLLNIQRSFSSLSTGTPYPGHLEIAFYNEKLTLVNEVPLEKYLYSVVPSEMPVQFGLEALKVQAIAARSYAVRCFESSGFSPYGAHVDDSTASQVYNNIQEQTIAVQAVEDTRGLVPFYQGEIVDARFFSTSCGYSANFHEVWSDKDNNFPCEEVPYLISKPQYSGDIPSLYNEENFRAFINQEDLPGYDRFSPFFRWTVTLTRQQLEASVNKYLPQLNAYQSPFVLTRNADGNFVESEVPDDVGEILNLEVLRRGKAGNIMEFELTTTKGVFRIYKEYNVRRLLSPANHLNQNSPVKLHCHDGSVRNNFPILPSAFAYINLERNSEGHITTVTITGGGFGHGVGMSQYGTYGLTLLGRTYAEIIKHYYPGTELINIYNIDKTLGSSKMRIIRI